MECANCGHDLPLRPEEAVEVGELDEFVRHVHNAADWPAAVKQAELYCTTECAAEAWGEI